MPVEGSSLKNLWKLPFRKGAKVVAEDLNPIPKTGVEVPGRAAQLGQSLEDEKLPPALLREPEKKKFLTKGKVTAGVLGAAGAGALASGERSFTVWAIRFER